jgi:ribosomal-protein-alanine N-acetyltransferase
MQIPPAKLQYQPKPDGYPFRRRACYHVASSKLLLICFDEDFFGTGQYNTDDASLASHTCTVYSSINMLNVNATPFPVLTTARLTLRQLTMQDDQQIFIIRSHPGINSFLDRPATTSIEAAAAFIEKIEKLMKMGQCVYWGLNLEAENSLIGTICFWNFNNADSSIEIGYELLPAYQGKGIMKEAIDSVIPYGFSVLKAKKIIAAVSPDNTKSIALLKKANFALQSSAVAATHKAADPLLIFCLQKDGS